MSLHDENGSDPLLSVKLRRKGQADRLGMQHELAGGAVGIFGEAAQLHDASIRDVAVLVVEALQIAHPRLEFRSRQKLSKAEIHQKLQQIDNELGQTLFVGTSSVRPDGGLVEVKDGEGEWRVVLVSECKHQGNDIEKIKAGIMQGKAKNQDLMVAGNAIERVHKNICEFKNFMLDESHFPYVVFLQGSNFATTTVEVERPDGRLVVVAHDSGMLNRIDRVTASNYGLGINQNHCRNRVVKLKNGTQQLHVASLFFQCDPWAPEEMFKIMYDVAETSLTVIFS